MKTDNELIAEFMGHPNWKSGSMDHMLPYDTSWDWLMPVVEKIGQLDNVYKTEITDCTASIYSDETFESIDGGIEGVYAVVIKFIKWYLQQKP